MNRSKITQIDLTKRNTGPHWTALKQSHVLLN